MPLASSKSSTEKAMTARLSLPATIDSSTRVTRKKAMKRRASLRSKREPSPARSDNKENTDYPKECPPSPGPTPYWKVSKISDPHLNQLLLCTYDNISLMPMPAPASSGCPGTWCYLPKGDPLCDQE